MAVLIFLSGHRLHVANFGSLPLVAYRQTRDGQLDRMASSLSDDMSAIAAVVGRSVNVLILLG